MSVIEIVNGHSLVETLSPLAVGLASKQSATDKPGAFSRFMDRMRARRAQRETARMLHALDIGTLRDLGITPREVESLVYGDNGDRSRSYDRDWWRK